MQTGHRIPIGLSRIAVVPMEISRGRSERHVLLRSDQKEPMDIANALAVILGGVFALSSVIIANKPDARTLIDKLTPYQALIGLVLVILGVIDVVRALPYLSDAFTVNYIYAAVVLSMLAVSVLLGALFGMPQIAKMIAGRSPADHKALEISHEIAPYQIILGLIGMVSALLFLLYRCNVVHWQP
jgi:hypothetical protein